jgi:opacity protein-like surface antigen
MNNPLDRTNSCLIQEIKPMKKLALGALLGVLASTGALSAQEAHFGLQLHLAKPTGKAGDTDHLDGKMGFGVGAQVPVYFSGGNVFRPKLDYVTFSRDSNGINQKATTLALIADYNRYFNGTREGGYLILGLGFHNTKREVSGYGISVDTTDTGLAYNLGIGFTLSKSAALEFKYMGAELGDFKYQGILVDSSYAANAFVASVSFTF